MPFRSMFILLMKKRRLLLCWP
jgi:hypothetical protein